MSRTIATQCEHAVKRLAGIDEHDGNRRSLLYSTWARALYLSESSGKAPGEEYDRFQKAHNLLDLARHGVPVNPRTSEVRLVSQLRNAELLLLRAAARKVTPDVRDQTEQRVRAAKDALRDARALLEERGQVLRWWECYFRLSAELELARLYLFQRHGRDDASRLRLCDIVRAGLLAVRCSLDLQLPARAARTAEELSALPRLDPILTLYQEIGEQFKSVAVRRPRSEESPQAPPQQLLATPEDIWVRLNHQAGLVRLPKHLPLDKLIGTGIGQIRNALCQPRK